MRNIFVLSNSHGYMLIDNVDMGRYLTGEAPHDDCLVKEVDGVLLHSIYTIGAAIWWSTEEHLEAKYELYMKGKCQPGDIVYGFIGDVDIRYYISRYGNAINIVSMYVNRMRKVFEKYGLEVRIIEPMPLCLHEDWSLDEWYTRKGLPPNDKFGVQKIQDDFVGLLKQACRNHGLKEMLMISNNVIEGRTLSEADTTDTRHLNRVTSDKLMHAIANW